MEKKEKTSTVVGITGGICTGKTSVLNVFKGLGYAVFSCDENIKRLKKENKNIIKEIEKEFPDAKGREKTLGEIVFSSKQRLEKLEEILLPELEKERRDFIEKNKGKTVFIEVPLLYEKNKEKDYKRIIVTTCSQKTQEQRAVKRGISVVLLKKILKNQMPVSEKAQKADYLINSDEDYDKMKKKALEVCKQIEKE